jgi:2,3-diaminopropionate biosynthesis protein SbnA
LTTEPLPALRSGVLATIGNTPLVELERYLDGVADARLWLKLEAANPGGSAKDRPAAAMLEAALATGRLKSGGTVIESSSGNMGIGLAQACRYLGLRFICVVDLRTSPEKIATMRAYGAEVEVVTAPDPRYGDLLSTRIALVARLCADIPGSFWPDQYENPANSRSHAEGTMREIVDALGTELDAVFVATSTAGTLVGCERCLRERGCEAELVAVDAEGSALFGGAAGSRPLPGLGAGIETGISRRVQPDALLRIGAAEAVIGCRRLVDREAIFAGASTGAVMAAVERHAPSLRAGARIAAISHDGGAGYLGSVYDDDWVASELGLSREEIEIAVRRREAAPAPA